MKCSGKDEITYNKIIYKCLEDFAFIPIPEDNKQITIRMLLAHFAGVMEYENGYGIPTPSNDLINNPQYNTGIEWAVKYFINNPLIAIPDSKYTYTTLGINLVGLAIEKVTNRTFEELAYEMVISKAGMTSAIPDKHWKSHLYPNRAKGYVKGAPTTDNDVSFKLPGGGYMAQWRI